MKKLISIDVHASFGHLKKNDLNDGLSLTYSYLHKPALLGILGSIIGLKGYSQAYSEMEVNNGQREQRRILRLPEYYTKLKHIRTAVGLPYGDKDRHVQKFGKKDEGTFAKMVIGYNNSVGYANDGSTLQVKEQTLVKPEYRIFIELDASSPTEKLLYEYLVKGYTTYIPYLGKNEFPLHWNNVVEYSYTPLTRRENIRISSLFRKKDVTVKELREASSNDDYLIDDDYNEPTLDDIPTEESFFFLETLPTDYHPETGHYITQLFAYTNWKLKFEKDKKIYNLYEITNENNSTIIELM